MEHGHTQELKFVIQLTLLLRGSARGTVVWMSRCREVLAVGLIIAW